MQAAEELLAEAERRAAVAEAKIAERDEAMVKHEQTIRDLGEQATHLGEQIEEVVEGLEEDVRRLEEEKAQLIGELAATDGALREEQMRPRQVEIARETPDEASAISLEIRSQYADVLLRQLDSTRGERPDKELLVRLDVIAGLDLSAE